jgi:MFS family permease
MIATQELPVQGARQGYRRFLAIVSGLAGLLYGIDVGIIDPALPYLHRATSLSEGELSLVVAAVLAGSILGSVIAGVLADWLGRKPMMVISALMFVLSVAVIYLSQSFVPLLLGRVLQGMSGGVIAVVVPLFLAECLPADGRGRGMALFQFMLTVGIVLAAFVGNYYLGNAELAIQAAGADQGLVTAAADHAWRSMFLTVMYPGVLFLLGCCFVSESPRWLMRRGRPQGARAALLRLRPAAAVDAELAEIEAGLAAERSRPKRSPMATAAEMLTERRYVLPFILACVILGCNQATGINSLLQFMSTILQKAGLDPVAAGGYGTAIKILNSVMTVVAIVLVERKGRVFLLKLGTSGIIAVPAGAAVPPLRVGAPRRARRHRGPGGGQPRRLQPGGRALGRAGAGATERPVRVRRTRRRRRRLDAHAQGAGGAGPRRRRDGDAGAGRARAGRAGPGSVARTRGRRRRRRAGHRAAAARHAQGHRGGAPRPERAARAHRTAGRRRRGAAAAHPPRQRRPDAGRRQRRAGRAVHRRLHRRVLHRSRRVRVAGAVRTDAHADPLGGHGRGAADQPGHGHADRRRLPAARRQLRLLRDVPVLGWVHGDLLRDGGVLPAGDQGQVAGGDRGDLCARTQREQVDAEALRHAARDTALRIGNCRARDGRPLAGRIGSTQTMA